MNMSVSMHSRYLQRALEIIRASITGMQDEEMNWAPETKWSSTQLIEHLSLSFKVTARAAKMVLRQPKPDVPAPTWRQRLLIFQVVDLGYAPKPVKAPRMVVPRGLGPQEARIAIVENLIEMDQLLQLCHEKFGRRTPILPHASIGPLTARQWCKFQLFHTRRHMKQLLRLRKQMAQSTLRSQTAPVSDLAHT